MIVIDEKTTVQYRIGVCRVAKIIEEWAITDGKYTLREYLQLPENRPTVGDSDDFREGYRDAIADLGLAKEWGALTT